MSEGESIEFLEAGGPCPLLAARRPGSGVASVQIWVPAGSRAESAFPGSGAAHFLEHMVFKGTSKRTALEINREAERMGGMLNAYTSYDRTVYHLDLPSANVSAGMELLSDFVWNPSFPVEGFEPEREVILREMAMVHDDPDDVLFHAVVREALQTDLLRFPVIGDEAPFRALTLDHLKEFHRTYYRGGGTFRVLGGDVGESQIEEAGNLFLRGSPPSGDVRTVSPVSESPRPVRLRLEGNWEEGRGLALFLVPVAEPGEARSAEWVMETLAGGESGLLIRRLRNELELVHHIDGFLYGMGSVALLGFSWMADSNQLEKAEEEFFRVLDACRRDLPSGEDLRRGWDRCRFQRLRLRQSVEGWVSQVAEELMAFGRIPRTEEDPIFGPYPGGEAWMEYLTARLGREQCFAGFLKGTGTA